MISRLAAATVALVVMAGAMTGCSSPATPSEPTPAFTSEDEAFAAAEATYRAYVDALNDVDLSDPSTFEEVYAWTTGDANAGERKSLSEMHASGWTVDGKTVVTVVNLASFQPGESPAVTIEVCTNVEGVDVIDASGNSVVSADRPPTQSAVVALETDLVTVRPPDLRNRRRRQGMQSLVTAALLAIVLPTVGPVAVTATDCYSNSNWTGVCVGNSGSQVDIGASNSRPGSSHPGTDDGYTSPQSPPPSSQNPAPADPADCPLDRCDLPYDVVSPPDVTLADLASFRPARPTLGGEPSGFGVVGMPANIVASASEQRIPGTLLGWDVTVRFVPAGFVFHYGDGSTATTTTGGASWRQLRQAQFTPTATSHIYRERGSYPVSVDVQYAASVDFGSGTWRPVAGYVTATTGGYDVRVVEVRTALVEKTCAENPRGPGC